MILQLEKKRLEPGGRVVLLGIDTDFAADVVDSIGRVGAEIAAAVLLGEPEWMLSSPNPIKPEELHDDLYTVDFFVPRNNPGLRKERLLRAFDLGFKSLVTIIDTNATVSSQAEIGSGVFINAGAVVGSQATIGSHVFVNRLASLGHHCFLHDFVSIGPGATVASRVQIGKGTMVGAGATIGPGVSIGSNSVVSMGAVVHKDAPSNVLLAGNPARIVKTGIIGPRDHSV